MSAVLSISEDFLNQALSNYLPENVNKLKTTIDSDYIVVTFPVSFIGIKINPSAAFRIVSFTWTDEKKVFVLELIKTSILDSRPSLAYVKRFFPDFITIENNTFLLIDILKIPAAVEFLKNPLITQFQIEKIGVSKGSLSISVDFV